MPIYSVVKPIRIQDGRTLGAGATVEMTRRQAKWLLLAGKIAQAPAFARAATKPKSIKEK